VRPSYLRIFRAYLQCLEDGKAPTYANLGRVLCQNRQTVHGMFQRHPDLDGFIHRHIAAQNGHYVGAVVRRAGILAMQGSPEHMRIYLE
jgi:hypothetical protein